MEANPFATTLCIAVEKRPMKKKEKQQLHDKLRNLRMSYWEYLIECIRGDMHQTGIDLDGVTIEAEEEEDEERQRFLRIAGIRSDQAFSVKAIVKHHCVVIDDDFDPTTQNDELEDLFEGDEEDQREE